jgi:hypothetical protein
MTLSIPFWVEEFSNLTNDERWKELYEVCIGIRMKFYRQCNDERICQIQISSKISQNLFLDMCQILKEYIMFCI